MFYEHKVSKTYHLQHGCLLESLFRATSKKTWKIHIIGSLWEESIGDRGLSHRGPVMQKAFPCLDIIMLQIYNGYNKFSNSVYSVVFIISYIVGITIYSARKDQFTTTSTTKRQMIAIIVIAFDKQHFKFPFNDLLTIPKHQSVMSALTTSI